MTSLVFRAVLVLGLACIPVSKPAQSPTAHKEALGTVSFAISCDPQVQADFNRGVALLHSFTYTESEQAFAAVAQKDPKCAMAHWGVAMSVYHQLWEPPGPEDLRRGSAEVARAQELGAGTERERDFISALAVFYKDWQRLDHMTRAQAYEHAMEAVFQRYPGDRETGLFYALSLIATAPPTDKTRTNQKKAAEILEKAFAEEPNHPGAAHYLIHAYDYPELAARGLPAARAYSKIAPTIPHALHMPSHIFTRLGLWQDSVDSNIASEQAAKAHGDIGEQLHAMDYLAYAYLQMGRDKDAAAVHERVHELEKGRSGEFKSGYAGAAIPARYALERKNWAEAARLNPSPDAAPATAAITYWARAIGKARSNDTASARADIAALEQLHDKLKAAGNQYWAGQVTIQIEEASAWAAFVDKKRDEALHRMRSAADLEDATEKHPVTPGAVVPARELLADMLIEAGRPADALTEYEAVLGSAPGRFNAVEGAAKAAKLAVQKEKAGEYYAQLLKLAPASSRPEVQQARVFLSTGPGK